MTPDVHLLHRLTQADDGFVSGNQLAAELGMSRVSIWQRIQALQDEGIVIEARRNRGYRLLSTPTGFHPALLEATIHRRLPALPALHLLDTTTSTNNIAERLLSDQSPTPGVVIAGTQTEGRGRLGRAWHSCDSGNLYLSLYLRPQLPPARMQTVTLWFGLALCQYLSSEWQLPIQLKWPNDLLIDGKKVAGMLSESRIDADQMRDFIFGLGLNINGDPSQWPDELQGKATTLSTAAGQTLPFHELAAGAITALLNSWDSFTADSNPQSFIRQWDAFDYLKNRELEVLIGQNRIRGTADGINPDGTLRLRQVDGTVIALASGEVTLAHSRTLG